MKFFIPIALFFALSTVLYGEDLEFENLAEVLSRYDPDMSRSEIEQFHKEAYNFINSEFRRGNQDEAYETISEFINRISPDRLAYWHTEFTRARCTMAVGVKDEEQVNEDLNYMQEVAESSNADSVKAVANYSIAETLRARRDFSGAIAYYDLAVDKYERIGNFKTMITAMVFLSSCYDYQYDSKEAIRILEEAVEKTERYFEDDPERRDNLLYRIYISLGNVIKKTREFELSNEYYLKTLDLPSKDQNYRSTSYSNIATNYLYMLDYEQAEIYARKAVQLTEVTRTKRKLALNCAIRIFNQTQQLDSSAVYLAEFEEIAGDPSDSRHSLYLTRRADYDFFRKDYGKAYEGFLDVLVYLREKEPTKLSSIRYALEGINKVNLSVSGRDSALFYFEEMINQIDTLDQKENENEILAATVRYRTALTEAENKRLEEENKYKTYGLFSLLALLVISTIAAVGWLRGLKVSKKYNSLLEEEKQELSQLNHALKKRNEELQLLADPEAKIGIALGQKKFYLALKDIVYVFMKNDTSHYQLKSGEVRRSTFLFKDAELGLPKDKFFRPKRGYLVNLDHVRYVNTDHILMEGDYKVPLTKARRRVWLSEFDENL